MKKKYIILLTCFIVLNGLFFARYTSDRGGEGTDDIQEQIDDTTILFVQGNYNEYLDAIVDTRKIKDPESWYRVAVSYIKTGDLEAGEDYLAKSYASFPSPFTEKLMKTVVLMNKEDWSGAEKMLTTAKSKNKVEMSVASILKGLVLFEKKKTGDALKQFQTAENQDPSASITLAYIGRIQSINKKWSAAYQYLNRADNLGYTADRFIPMFADAAYKTKKYDRANELYEEIFTDEINDVEAYSIYADSLLKTKQLTGALAILDRATTQYTDNIGLWRKKASIYISQDLPEKALEAYDEVASLVMLEKKVEIWIEQMMLHHTMGNQHQSDLLEQQVHLNTNKKDIALMVLFANKLMAKGSYDRANEYTNLVLTQNPKQKHALKIQKQLLTAESLTLLRNGTTPEDFLEQLKGEYPNHIETLWVDALQAIKEEQDYALALRTLQIALPTLTLDEVRLNYIRYLVHEGEDIQLFIEDIEDKETYLLPIALLLWKHSILTDNEALRVSSVQQLQTLLPEIDESRFDATIQNHFVIAKHLSIYYK